MVAFTTSKPLSLTEAASDRKTGTERPHMRLAPLDDASDSLSITRNQADRRCFPRRDVSLRLRGKRLDHSVDARREPFLNLQMRDVSMGGLAATSQTCLRVGERVAVFFPPEAGARGWDAYGRIRRVHTSETGYDVAVEFDTMPAA